jgi:hypothetical protein
MIEMLTFDGTFYRDNEENAEEVRFDFADQIMQTDFSVLTQLYC